MLGKIIVTLIAASVLRISGWAAVKYGTNWLDNKASEKIKIRVDDDGKCQILGDIKSLIESKPDQSENQSSNSEEGDQCLNLLKSKINWNRVEIDWGKRKEQYKEFQSQIKSALQKLVGEKRQGSVVQ